MSNLEDFINVNKEALLNTLKELRNNMLVIFTVILYSLIYIISQRIISILLVGPIYIIGGIIWGILVAAIISSYLHILDTVTRGGKLSLNTFKEGFGIYLYKVYGVMVFFYLVRFITIRLGLYTIYTIFMLGSILALNALPETLYQKSYDAYGSLAYSLDFAKDNILNWYLSNGIIFLILILVNMFSHYFSFSIMGIGELILSVVLSLAMLYRGFLFKILSTSTKRKREFMGKFN